MSHEDIRVIIATAAAQDFVENYYPTLNNIKSRSSLSSFYVNSASANPDIIINGNIISSPNDLQLLFQTQVQRASYDVQSYDAHILNGNYKIGNHLSTSEIDIDDTTASIVVLVSGSVKYWKEGEVGETRGFTETVVLVPNPDAHGSILMKGKTKKWLISCQNFRLVV